METFSHRDVPDNAGTRLLVIDGNLVRGTKIRDKLRNIGENPLSYRTRRDRDDLVRICAVKAKDNPGGRLRNRELRLVAVLRVFPGIDVFAGIIMKTRFPESVVNERLLGLKLRRVSHVAEIAPAAAPHA